MIRRPARSRVAVPVAVAVVALAAGLAGCSSDDGAQSPTSASSGARTTFLVVFREWPDLGTTSTDWAGQGRDVVERLRDTAARAQRSARREAVDAGAGWRTLWVADAAVVRGPASLGDTLESDPSVLQVTRLARPATAHDDTLDPVDATATPSPSAALASDGAPGAWAEGRRGQGMVVGVIDTGVDATHPALRTGQRPTRSWFDAIGGCAEVPCDPVGHGTMAAGLAVGDAVPGGPAVGVAPDATWVAARACDDTGCPVDALLAASQWMIAPTDAGSGTDVVGDPGARPQVVNNSWGLAGHDTALDRAVTVWRAAGMVPVFAAGNLGPACGTVTDPGSRRDVVSVGAVNDLGQPLEESGRGRPRKPAPEPDLVAPGSAVVSTATGGGYAQGDGTSFAAAQVSGAAAVLRGALADPMAPGAVDLVTAGLTGSARRLAADEPCGAGTATGAGMLDLTSP